MEIYTTTPLRVIPGNGSPATISVFRARTFPRSDSLCDTCCKCLHILSQTRWDSVCVCASDLDMRTVSRERRSTRVIFHTPFIFVYLQDYVKFLFQDINAYIHVYTCSKVFAIYSEYLIQKSIGFFVFFQFYCYIFHDARDGHQQLPSLSIYGERVLF